MLLADVFSSEAWIVENAVLPRSEACEHNSFAIEQFATEVILEVPHLPADGCLGNVQLVRRPGETEMAGSRLEGDCPLASFFFCSSKLTNFFSYLYSASFITSSTCPSFILLYG